MEQEPIPTDQGQEEPESAVQTAELSVVTAGLRLKLDAVTKEPSGAEFDVFIESTLTAEANENVLLFGENSPFNSEREALGISGHEEEIAFEIKVLDISDSEWRAKTGNPASFAFIPAKWEVTKPIIFISKNTYKLLKGGRSFFGKQDLLHEYRHTQRSWVDERGKLYTILDEIAADYTSLKGVRPYIADALLIHCLCVVDEDLDPALIYRAYESGEQSQMMSFLAKWKIAYSDEGLDLLAEFKPGSQADGAKAVEFWESLLTLKEQKDPDWLKNFEVKIKPGPDKARKIIFSGFFNRIGKVIESSNAIRVKSFMALLRKAEDISKIPSSHLDPL
jgi:hypothetical protein